MKTFTFEEFQALCREQIAKHAAQSTSLRKAASNLPGGAPSAAAARKQHADVVYAQKKKDEAQLRAEWSLNSTQAERDELLAKGRALRLQARIEGGQARAENGKKRDALNVQRIVGPRVDARQWHWLAAMTCLHVREAVEAPYNDGIRKYGTVEKMLGMVADASGDARTATGFQVKYKHGRVVFDAATIHVWVYYPDRLPNNVVEYLHLAQNKSLIADLERRLGHTVEIDGPVVETGIVQAQRMSGYTEAAPEGQKATENAS